jgi:pimeloyl-ACP methyl ester carboxylesterase
VNASIDGRTMAWDDTGMGPALLFLHGFPHDRRLWAAQLATLSREARCVAPDLRGFGESAPMPADTSATMDAYADDVVRLLDHLAIDRATVCGLSMGGYVALALWRRHADRVGALVLSDTRAGADDEAGRARRREMAALARTSGSAAVTDAMIPGMLGKTTRARTPDVERQLRMMGEAADAEGLAAALEAMMARPDSTPTLETIDVPTLVIVGDEDALTPPKQAEVLADGIRGARLEIIAGAGHVPCLERPAAFNLVLGEFVAQLATA